MRILHAFNLTSPERVHRIATRVSDDLDAATSSLESRLAPFRNASRLMVSSHAGAIELASGQRLSTNDRQAAERLRETLHGMSRTTGEAIQFIAAFRAAAQGLREQRISQRLSERCARLIRAVDTLTGMMREIANQVEGVAGRLNRLLSNRKQEG